MNEGFYTDPKHPTNAKAKVAVVITFFDAGKKNYWGHFTDEKAETLKMNLRAHQHFNPGVAYDLIIINHGGLDEKEFFKLPESYGVRVIEKSNFGYGFGGWKQAWMELGDRYEFYCFTEDDIAPTKDGWLSEILLKFMEKWDTGAVGNIVEARSRDESGSAEAWKAADSNREMMYNFDGGYTFTSSKILKQVDEIGGLTVLDCGPGGVPPTLNEILFQQQILELGYRIVSFADGEHFLVHGSEILTNDVMYRTGPPAPLLNLNGRHKVPEIANIFKDII